MGPNNTLSINVKHTKTVMKNMTESLRGANTTFAAAKSSATLHSFGELENVMQFEPDYVALAAELVEFFKDRVRPIDVLEFRKNFNGGITPNQRMRLFSALVKKFSLQPTETNNLKKKYSEFSQRYIFDIELRNSLAVRLTPEKVELLCLSERIFRKVGRRNPKEEAKIQERINVLLGKKVVADGEYHPEVTKLSEIVPDLSPMPEEKEETISPEEQEIIDLKAKLESLQREVAEKQAALDKKNKLIKTGKEILEMFNISVEELKEIVNLL